MRHLLALSFYVFTAISTSFAQTTFPQEKINEGLKNVLNHSSLPKQIPSYANESLPGSPAHFFQRFPYGEAIHVSIPYNNLRDADTLIVGVVPHDTLSISGSWFHDGPVIVANDGVLIFQNAQATINGDLYVLNKGKVFADGSSIYFPQQYFYQRNILALNDAVLQFTSSSLNFSGLSHSYGIADSALIQYQNVNVIGFTTTGLYQHGSFVIDTCNLVGEIVVTDESNLNVSNGDTVLVWHQFPDTSVIHRSFPNGNIISQYSFSSASNGVSGISYSINLTNCTTVFWGLMPVNGSDVTIDSSDVRAIGAWFTGSDATDVSGLVDGSYYESSSNLFSDRNLQLNKTTVHTWSIYPMDSSVVNLSNCILGEVGSEQRSTVNAQYVFVDGTGGYFWATDQSFLVAGFSAFTCTIRGQGNGILVVAYSGITSGAPEATGNSILILLQDGTLQEPEIFDASEVWVGNLGNPVSALVDSSIKINGSAYIDRTAISFLPLFGSYQIYYQLFGNTLWQPISGIKTTAVHDNLLDTWDTHGLSPGLYTLKLVLKDNLGDSVEAVNTINLLPNFTGVSEYSNPVFLQLFPDPANESIFIQGDLKKFHSLGIFNDQGQQVQQIFLNGRETKILVATNALPSGLYSLKFDSNSGGILRRMVIQH